MPNSLKLLDYYILSNAPPKKRQYALKTMLPWKNGARLLPQLLMTAYSRMPQGKKFHSESGKIIILNKRQENWNYLT